MQQRSLLCVGVSLPYEGVTISMDEGRAFFREFHCEQLTSNEKNKILIQSFQSKNNNDDLEDYLLNEKRAWANDLDGETRVYLIKDMAGSIACYFSLKCGLVVGDKLDEQLSDEERSILEPYIEAKKDGDEETERQLYDAISALFPERAEALFTIALNRLERKTEAIEIGQSKNTINVPMCYSGIELKHLCRNENYKPVKDINVPLGFGFFWEKIVPIVVEISKKVGCKYLYIFAADNSKKENDKGVRKLVRYYKNEFKFYECSEEIKFVKPDYDNYCYGLVQEVSKLILNRKAVWEEFSDVRE